MKRAAFAFVMSVVLMSGCATSGKSGPVTRAVNHNVSQAQADHDTLACNRESGLGSYTPLLFGARIAIVAQQQEDWADCMEAKGYTIERKDGWTEDNKCKAGEVWDYTTHSCV